MTRDLMDSGAKVIGLGETIHGCETLHEMIFAVARGLIETGEVELFGMEMPESTMRAWNHYVTGARADLQFGMCDRAFQSIALREFLQWLRTWNLSPGRSSRVSLFGFDIRDPWVWVPSVLASGLEFSVAERAFLDGLNQNRFNELEGLQSNRQMAAGLVDLMRGLANRLSRVTGGRRELQIFEEALRYLATAGDLDAEDEAHRVRDLAMYRLNADRIHAVQGGKVLLFGHIFHLAKRTEKLQLKGMPYRYSKSFGEHLSRAMGAAYVAAGFSLQSGSYRRDKADELQVIAAKDSVEATALFKKSDPEVLRASSLAKFSANACLGAFTMVEGEDVDDSRSPIRGPIKNIIDVMVVSRIGRPIPDSQI